MKFKSVARDVTRFQQPLSDIQIETLCRRAFGRSFDVLDRHFLEAGKFNTCYKITPANGKPVILRVAPPPGAVIFGHETYLLRREATILPPLHRACPRVPRNLFVDFSRRTIERDYVFQNYLPGDLWDDVKNDLTDAENERLWRQLGIIVKRIHAVPGNRFGPPHPRQQRASWSEAMFAWLTHMLTDMQKSGLPCTDVAKLLQLAKDGRHHLDQVRQPSLVHGDLWQRNILIGRDNGVVEITAVLDAERAFWGDPEAEWIFTFLDIPDGFWHSRGGLRTDPSAIYRRLIYEGRGAAQLCLEGWRFGFDDAHYRDILQQVIGKLRLFDTLAA